MKSPLKTYGIWIDEKSGNGMLFGERPTEEELAGLREAGLYLKLEKEFKVRSKQAAQKIFISWVRQYKQPDARVERLDFVAAGLRDPKGD